MAHHSIWSSMSRQPSNCPVIVPLYTVTDGGRRRSLRLVDALCFISVTDHALGGGANLALPLGLDAMSTDWLLLPTADPT